MNYKVIVKPSLKSTLRTPTDIPEPPTFETLNLPTWLQEYIITHQDEFIKEHPYVYPNIAILQDDLILSAQFDRQVIEMNPKDRPEWFNHQYHELRNKLKTWQGQELFEWMNLKIYNRHHVVANRDNPIIFIEHDI